MSVLGVFDIAKTALFVTRKTLDTIANNVANANTPGYTRQDVVLNSIASGQISSTGESGRGVTITQIKRLYDSFVNLQLNTEKSNSSYWDTFASGTTKIEDIFNEANNKGTGAAITDFFNAWGDVAQNPGGYAERTTLINKAEYLTTRISSAYTSLSEERDSLYKDFSSLIQTINSITPQIGELNTKIASSPGALDLIDQRDALVQQLNSIIKVNTYDDNSGRTAVMLGGTPLVEGEKSFQVVGALDTNNNVKLYVDIKDPAGNILEQRDVTSLVSGGGMKATIDLRDTTLPSYMNKINTLATALTQTVNYYHQSGYGLDGLSGRKFFQDVTPPYATTDSNITSGSATIADSNVSITNINQVHFGTQYQVDYQAASLTVNSGDSFTINGVNYPLSAIAGTYTNITTFLNKLNGATGINSAVSGVAVSFDPSSNAFTFTNNNAGPVNVSFPSSNFRSMLGFSSDIVGLAAGASTSGTSIAPGTGYQEEVDPGGINTGIFWRVQQSTDGQNWSVVNSNTVNIDAASAAPNRILNFQGLSVQINGAAGGLPPAGSTGETFTVQPNPNAALEMSVAVNDANQIAAALGDVDTRFTVTAGLNDRINTSAGNVNLTAGVAYTRFDLADNLQNALNNAYGAGATTVTFDAQTGKFRIMNNTGAAITINWASQSSTTAEDFFGFTADTTIQPGSYADSNNQIKGGSVVIDSTNNSIRFSEDGGNTYVTATVPQGTYTRAELGTVLGTALANADPNTNYSYSVAYDASAMKYTIANGFGIKAGDKITVTIGGVPTTYNLTAGTYTGTGLAAQLTANLAGSNVSVSYNAGTNKFTLTNANGVPVTVSGAVGVLNEIGFTANPTVPAGGSAPGDKAVAANANNIILDWADTSSTAKSIFGFNSSPSISSVSSAASDYAVYPVLPGDNRNAKLIAGIMNQQVISGATPGDYYQQIVSGVGVDTQTSKQSQQFETNLVNQLQNKRDEVSGVSLDEEAANLVKYQKSYEAAAKMVSIAEELLTTLINMTGR